MKELLLGKKLLFLGIVAFVAALFLLFFLYRSLQGDGVGDMGRDTPLQITSLTPDPSQVLIAGESQEFEILFTQPVSSGRVRVTLESFDPLQSSSPEPIQIQTEQIQDSAGVRVVMQEDVATYQVYLLDIYDMLREEGVGSFAFDSTLQSVERAPENNIALAEFLPHETESYRLVYVENLNTYVFNFKLDPSSSLSANAQFEQAKTEAENYITERGVSLESIVIEWRRS